MSLRKHTMILVSGTALAQIVPFLFIPVLARIYTPGNFGHYGLFYELTTFFLIVSSLGYEKAIVIEGNESKAERMMVLCMLVNFTFSLLLIPFTLVASNWISGYTGIGNIWLQMTCLSLLTLISGYGNILKYKCIRESNYRVMARANIARSLSSQVIAVALGYSGFTAVGLIAGYAIGSLIENRMLAWSLSYSYKDALSRTSKGELIKLGRSYIKLPTLSLSNSVLNEVSLKLPTYLFNLYFSTVMVGHFFQARRIVMAPSLLIGDAFKKVMFQKMAENHAAERSSYKLAASVYFRFLFIGILPSLICLFWGDTIISFVLGPAWAESGKIIQIIILSVLFQVAYLPLSSYFEIIMEQRITVMWNISMIVLRTIAVVVGAKYASFLNTLLLFTIVNAAGYLMISMLALNKLKTYKNGTQLQIPDLY